MGRRKGGLTELMEVASKQPWKVSASLAPITFLALHLIAAAFERKPAASGLPDLGTVVIHQYIYVFAAILQYVIPFVFLIGAVMSFLRRSRSRALFDDVRNDSRTNVAALSWQKFESLVEEGFRHRGFQVAERGGAGPDGGVDLALSRGSERFLVQCKQWRARQVGVSVIRELYGVMAAERVAGGYVVTSGTFTKDAKEFASGRNIELIDGKGLDELLREGRAVVRLTTAKMEAGPKKARPPTCPKCKSPLVLRTAKKGSHVGSSFWGCGQYPKCRQTMAMG
jgi:restriction system protein